MTGTLQPARWMSFLEREYIGEYVRLGGAAVKIAVAVDEPTKAELEEAARAMAERTGLVELRVDSAVTRIHMMHQLFFALATQVPWREMARDVVLGLLAHEGFVLHGWAPAADGEDLITQVARHADQDEAFVLGEIRRALTRRVLKRTDLAREFRVAMTQLCLAELRGGEEGEVARWAIQGYLTGAVKGTRAVAPYQIHRAVTRTNARYFLESLFVWVRVAGRAGTLLMLDFAALPVKGRGINYSRAAVLDAYELLRQLIDATDRLDGCLVLVLAGPEFLDDNPTGRGVGGYDALRLRVVNEIRDETLVNEAATLVSVASPLGEGEGDR